MPHEAAGGPLGTAHYLYKPHNRWLCGTVRLRHLNWPSITFGAALGLTTNLVLFGLALGLGRNVLTQVAIQMVGFFVAGSFAGRFALVEPRLSGGFAALILFFLVVVVTVSGETFNLPGLIVLGTAAALLGPAGGAIAYNRTKL
ncbi:MAG: hypothetical protein O3B42_05890 [Actinomycetota bacterium]|nr:hypothetical protein [Actinomycetota bacterium]